MDLKRRGRLLLTACIAMGCMASIPAGAQTASGAKAAEGYRAHLGPTPVADGVTSAIKGEGSVTATLNGQALTVQGQFSGTAARPTDAQLMLGAGIGMPGPVLAPIGVAADGKINGSVKLSRTQVASLRAGHLYVQVNSAENPAPQGQLFGWLLPAHATAGEGEPQMGQWYLPQGAGLKARPSSPDRKS